jgi:hypothetical protein
LSVLTSEKKVKNAAEERATSSLGYNNKKIMASIPLRKQGATKKKTTRVAFPFNASSSRVPLPLFVTRFLAGMLVFFFFSFCASYALESSLFEAGAGGPV